MMGGANYNFQAADNIAHKKDFDRRGVQLRYRRKRLWEALEEAKKPMTEVQEKYRDKYGDRYACVPGSCGVGCVFKGRKEGEEWEKGEEG